MAVIDAAFAAAGGATSLALAATLWALTQRRRAVARIRELSAALERYEGRMDAAHASAEAFDSAVVAVEGGRIRLASGRESLIACGQALGLGPQQAEVPAGCPGADPLRPRACAPPARSVRPRRAL